MTMGNEQLLNFSENRVSLHDAETWNACCGPNHAHLCNTSLKCSPVILGDQFPTSSPNPANCSSRTHPDSHLLPLPNAEINRCQLHKVKAGRDVSDRAREKSLNNIHNVKVYEPHFYRSAAVLDWWCSEAMKLTIRAQVTHFTVLYASYIYMWYILRLANIFSVYRDQHLTARQLLPPS